MLNFTKSFKDSFVYPTKTIFEKINFKGFWFLFFKVFLISLDHELQYIPTFTNEVMH